VPDAGRWLARDRGAFEVETTIKDSLIVQPATAELQDFLSEAEQRWMAELFVRLAR
jgi:hypothetical protein